ncbi:MAG: Na+/H+ antiporter NhaC [Rhodanobacteraceae bacterium]|nr:Na+/H+ antiporter NhaC [Xanthomonadales bacterium]MCP5479189.1 Na+/H+ antiporter NhaC [Rhodanobacteraceae bacterium]HPF73110.1 Na+/H+ antiporter NhaC [Xanthomonadaceae bacterium]HRX99662.1 Na+/H+ antiporter NhaC [Xanthomonadaceae bacterium]
MQDSTTGARQPSLLQALTPLLFLIVALALSVHLYGDNSSYGANQIVLLLAAGVAGLIGIRNGLRWQDIEDAIVHGVSVATGAMFILFAVGALIGTWILAGIVPTLIYYGVELLSPSFFYPATCLICAIVGLTIGSSWTVAGTLGVALMGVSQGLGLSPAITAGAIISGAYFGDKMSPLSDTTNLAPATAGSDLFAHIRHMTWTTLPSIAVALVLFAVFSFTAETNGDGGSFAELDKVLSTQFNIGLHLLIPLLVVFVMALRKFPALPTIAVGALLGAIFAVVFQPEQTMRLAGNAELSKGMALLGGAWHSLFDGFSVETGNEAVDSLLSRGGFNSMINTVALIMCAMAFGAVMERTSLLERLARAVLSAVHSTGSLITATLATSVGCNIVAADQYMAIVLPGRLYRAEFRKRGLAPVNLSRALEDAGTLTSPLVPWNTCGAYMAATLGIATTAYLPYAFFNLLNPLIAAAMAYAGFKIIRHEPPQKEHKESVRQ